LKLKFELMEINQPQWHQIRTSYRPYFCQLGFEDRKQEKNLFKQSSLAFATLEPTAFQSRILRTVFRIETRGV
jgi:hypothetical protein